MSEILRLIRISLLLRLIPAALGVVAALFVGDGRFITLIFWSALPSLLLLLLTWVQERRNRVTPQHLRRTLVLVIGSYALDVVLPVFIARYGLQMPLFSVDHLLSSAGMAQRSQNMFNGSLFFTLIPTVLGAWMSGRRGAFRWAGIAILVNLVAVVVLRWLIQWPQVDSESVATESSGYLAQILVTAVVCYFVGSLADRQRAEHAQLQEANRELAKQGRVREQLAASRERISLSRDLHDTVAHTLAALSVQMNAIAAVLEGPQPAARREVAHASALVKEGLNSTRQAISGMRANQVADLGLGEALRQQAEGMAQRTGLQVAFECTGPEFDVDDEVAGTLFRIGQEAMNNVERHSQAGQVQVSLLYQADAAATKSVVLTVRDDGTGFDADAILDQDRFGLLGMRERAAMIDAHLRIDSSLGHGTTVTATWRTATSG